MPDACTVFWTQDRCAAAGFVVATGGAVAGALRRPAHVPAQLCPAKVAAGDPVYPIGVRRQKLYVLGRMGVTELIEFTPASLGRMDEYVRQFPRWRFLAGGCMNEVVVGTERTPCGLDAAMPPELLRRLAYHSLRATRLVKHVNEEDRLVRSLGVQGIYR